MKTVNKNSMKTLIVFALSFTLFTTSCAQQNNTKTSGTEETSMAEVPKQDIHEAVITGNLEVLKQHIKAGSDLNKKDAMGGSTPLITAITFDKPEMVKALIEANVDLSIQNNDGSTALHTAAFFGKVEMVQMLIDANADKTIKNNFGATPRETVLGDFAEIKPFYEMIISQLAPMGFKLDLNAVKKARPVIAMMLQ
jgi:hypothetical protein